MFLIDTANAVASPPAPQPAGVPGWFSAADPARGIAPTTLTPDWCNTIQAEILNCLYAADIAPDKRDRAQLAAAISKIALNAVGEPLEAALAEARRGQTPVGGIIMWSGAAVPAGWALCDGQNGTPDLREKFIVGAGASYSIGQTGGVVSQSTTTAAAGGRGPSQTGGHALTVGQLPPHHHDHYTGSGEQTRASGYTANAQNPGPVQVLQTSNTGNGEAHTHPLDAVPDHTHAVTAWDNRPPFYALALIMRVA